MLVLVGVAALSMLAGYFFRPNRAVISTQPTTQSSAIDKDHCKKAGGEWDSKMNMCMEKKMCSNQRAQCKGASASVDAPFAI